VQFEIVATSGTVSGSHQKDMAAIEEALEEKEPIIGPKSLCKVPRQLQQI